MVRRNHHYEIDLSWAGNLGVGTRGYEDYARDFLVTATAKTTSIEGSADPAFRGAATRWNPEELLLASVAACHKLWYLHLCADANVVVCAYRDQASASMGPDTDGVTRILSAVLRPQVVISNSSDAKLAAALHADANAACFVANSVRFPIEHEPSIEIEN